MKRITVLLALFALLLISCEGSTGPPGPPGPEGPPGADGLIGSVFEVQVDFTASNGYRAFVDIPSSIVVYESDVVMAYILADVVDGLDIWEPLPQTLFLGNEILLYGFDYTYVDVSFFMDGTVNFGLLDPSFRNDIVFRVAVIPADFARAIDVNDLSQVMRALQTDAVMRVN